MGKGSAPAKAEPADDRQFSPTEVAILDAYLDLCYEQGVTPITLQKVAKRAKVAFGTVHYYFGGKEKSLEASASTYVNTRGRQTVWDYLTTASATPQHNPIHDYIRANMHWRKVKPQHVSYYIHFIYLSSIKSEFREQNAPFLAKARTLIQKLLYEGIGMGKVPPLKNIEELAIKINAMLFGAGFVSLADAQKGAVDRLTKATIETVDALIESHRK